MTPVLLSTILPEEVMGPPSRPPPVVMLVTVPLVGIHHERCPEPSVLRTLEVAPSAAGRVQTVFPPRTAGALKPT